MYSLSVIVNRSCSLSRCAFCMSICCFTALSRTLAAFQFLNLFYTVGRTSWTGDQPVGRSLPTHRTTQTHNKRTLISMSQVGFDPTIPTFERAKTVHALDRAATVVGFCMSRKAKETGKTFPTSCLPTTDPYRKRRLPQSLPR
jgi:hypothetical protein